MQPQPSSLLQAMGMQPMLPQDPGYYMNAINNMNGPWRGRGGGNNVRGGLQQNYGYNNRSGQPGVQNMWPSRSGGGNANNRGGGGGQNQRNYGRGGGASGYYNRGGMQKGNSQYGQQGYYGGQGFPNQAGNFNNGNFPGGWSGEAYGMDEGNQGPGDDQGQHGQQGSHGYQGGGGGGGGGGSGGGGGKGRQGRNKKGKNNQHNQQQGSQGDEFGPDIDLTEEGGSSSKSKRRSMSQSYPSRPWDREAAEKALAIEMEYLKALRNQNLIIRFPDPDLNKDIVKAFHPDIVNVHFQVPSGPRFCFVQLEEGADADKVMEDLSKHAFGNGSLHVEKRGTKEDDNLSAESIDPFTLYIGNLPSTITIQVMRDKFPTAARIDVGYAQRMKFTRYAFIRYHTAETALEAFKDSHNLQLENRSVIVRFRRQRGPTAPQQSPNKKKGEHETVGSKAKARKEKMAALAAAAGVTKGVKKEEGEEDSEEEDEDEDEEEEDDSDEEEEEQDDDDDDDDDDDEEEEDDEDDEEEDDDGPATMPAGATQDDTDDDEDEEDEEDDDDDDD